jgi:hypothetical protein
MNCIIMIKYQKIILLIQDTLFKAWKELYYSDKITIDNSFDTRHSYNETWIELYDD